MVLKNDADIANVVSMALATYANRVQNGLVQSYRGLLKETSVDVVLTVTEYGGIFANPIPECSPPQPAVIVDPVPVLHDDVGAGVIVLEEKPKRKRIRRKREKPLENPILSSA